MKRSGPNVRRRRLGDRGLQQRMVVRLLTATLGSFFLFTAGFLLYYQLRYAAGENRFREYIIVYRQIERVEEVEVDGRMVQRRSYDTVALPETARWRLVLPAVLVNNALLALVLGALAVLYSHRFAGPAYRIGADIQRSLRGEQGVRIRLRRGDELEELAGQVNKVLTAIDDYREDPMREA